MQSTKTYVCYKRKKGWLFLAVTLQLCSSPSLSVTDLAVYGLSSFWWPVHIFSLSRWGCSSFIMDGTRRPSPLQLVMAICSRWGYASFVTGLDIPRPVTFLESDHGHGPTTSAASSCGLSMQNLCWVCWACLCCCKYLVYNWFVWRLCCNHGVRAWWCSAKITMQKKQG